MTHYIIRAEYFENGRLEPATYIEYFTWDCPEALSAAWEKYMFDLNGEDSEIIAKWPLWENILDKSGDCLKFLQMKERICRGIAEVCGFPDWRKVLITGCWRSDATKVENLGLIRPYLGRY